MLRKCNGTHISSPYRFRAMAKTKPEQQNKKPHKRNRIEIKKKNKKPNAKDLTKEIYDIE